MPRKYRIRRRAVRRRYVRRKAGKGKRKAAKGQRQSETFNIVSNLEFDMNISRGPTIFKCRMFDQLFRTGQFNSMRNSYDQFKLNSVTFYGCMYSTVANVTRPFLLGYCFDRNGFPGGILSKSDITSYGSYKQSLSSLGQRSYFSMKIVATTMQEKSQYLPCDIQGMQGADDPWSADTIPLARNCYFSFNPMVAVFTEATDFNAQDSTQGHVRAKIQFNITFRGLRNYQDNGNVNDIRLEAHGEDDDTFVKNFDVRQLLEQPIRRPLVTIDGLPLSVKESVPEFQTPLFRDDTLRLKSTSNPVFNTSVSLISTITQQIGQQIYERWCSQIISACISSFTTAISNLGYYALRKVTNQIADFIGDFIATDPRSTFYWTDAFASEGLPTSVDVDARYLTDYALPFNLGLQISQFLLKDSYSYFANNSDNSSLDIHLFSGIQTFASGPVVALSNLYLQNGLATSLRSWSGLQPGSTLPITAYQAVWIQYPHSNYWITGIFWNKRNANVNFSLGASASQLCTDGFPLFNSTVSSVMYVSAQPITLSGVDNHPIDQVLTYSLSNSTTITNSSDAFLSGTIPISAFTSGLGIYTDSNNTTFWSTALKYCTFVYPVFISKTRLIN